MFRRKINIGDKVWRYHIGRRYVRIRSPEGKTHYVNKEKLAWDNSPVKIADLYGDEYKADVGLTPSAIKRYIEVVLIGKQRWFPHRHLNSTLARQAKYSEGPSALVFNSNNREEI